MSKRIMVFLVLTGLIIIGLLSFLYIRAHVLLPREVLSSFSQKSFIALRDPILVFAETNSFFAPNASPDERIWLLRRNTTYTPTLPDGPFFADSTYANNTMVLRIGVFTTRTCNLSKTLMRIFLPLLNASFNQTFSTSPTPPRIVSSSDPYTFTNTFDSSLATEFFGMQGTNGSLWKVMILIRYKHTIFFFDGKNSKAFNLTLLPVGQRLKQTEEWLQGQERYGVSFFTDTCS